MLVSGCSQYIDPNVPEPIRPFVEPEFGQEYLLYRPSSYDRQLAWPLIVACPGSLPDSPTRQIRAWTELAESHGFLVLTPMVSATRKSWSPKADKYIARLRADEDHIIAAIHHVSAAHHISRDRIFIYGWSTGAGPAVYTGVRHPHVFRAVALAQPKIKTARLTDISRVIDHHQPISVQYGVDDVITGKHGRNCVAWLREIGADLREDCSASVNRNERSATVTFFQELIHKEPWIYIRHFPVTGSDALTVQFKLNSTFPPMRYAWDFGDGDRSRVAEPQHTYAAPGNYRVTVTINGPGATEYHRTLDLDVP